MISLFMIRWSRDLTGKKVRIEAAVAKNGFISRHHGQ